MYLPIHIPHTLWNIQCCRKARIIWKCNKNVTKYPKKFQKVIKVQLSWSKLTKNVVRWRFGNILPVWKLTIVLFGNLCHFKWKDFSDFQAILWFLQKSWGHRFVRLLSCIIDRHFCQCKRICIEERQGLMSLLSLLNILA